MKVLLGHNYYLHQGGEDVAFLSEKENLRRGGHVVIEYVRHNKEIEKRRFLFGLGRALATTWSQESYYHLTRVIRNERPDIAHFHNFFPLISPAAHYACSRSRIPIVQTLHNYRLLCPSATQYREGRICEECTLHSLLRGVRYGCYRGSCLATAAVAGMISFHRLVSTWNSIVDIYIAPSQFLRSKFISQGFIPERIVVKPHFVFPDPGLIGSRGEYALFVGRLSPEKGLRTLIRAWKTLRYRLPLMIVGEGPERQMLEQEANDLDCIEFCGKLSREEVLAALRKSIFLVAPSESQETFGMTIVEAFACGVPVIAARVGAFSEIVEHQKSGLLFNPGDHEDLATQIEQALKDPVKFKKLGINGRKEYLSKYTAEENLRRTEEIYKLTVNRAAD